MDRFPLFGKSQKESFIHAIQRDAILGTCGKSVIDISDCEDFCADVFPKIIATAFAKGIRIGAGLGVGINPNMTVQELVDECLDKSQSPKS